LDNFLILASLSIYQQLIMIRSIKLNVNGQLKTIEADPSEPLLYILREEFGLNSPKYGCGLHQCGACTVLVDDKPAFTCLQPCESFEQKKIRSLEGLHTDDQLHPVQQAFVDTQAAQCGYCLNGMVLSAVALLNENSNPSDTEIRKALEPIICRCGTHSRFIQAVKSVAENSSI